MMPEVAPCPHRKVVLRQDMAAAYRGGTMEVGQPFHYCTECDVVVKVIDTAGDDRG